MQRLEEWEYIMTPTTENNSGESLLISRTSLTLTSYLDTTKIKKSMKFKLIFI